jgi:plastocyanin
MRRTPLLLVAALSISLAACSGGESAAEPTEAADGIVTFVGNDSVKWTDGSLTAVAVDGNLSATLSCDGAVPHNLVIDGVEAGAELVACAGNDSATVDVAIAPGTYSFHCSIPGHQAAGMEGTLTVS